MKTMTFNTQTSHGNKKWHSRQNTKNETQFMRRLVKLQKKKRTRRIHQKTLSRGRAMPRRLSGARTVRSFVPALCFFL
jgi:hypothetical protein